MLVRFLDLLFFKQLKQLKKIAGALIDCFDPRLTMAKSFRLRNKKGSIFRLTSKQK